MSLEVPKLLEMPGLMYPVLTEMNNYKFFVIEGGRGSGKTQSIARIILYLCETRRVRVFCGREVQDSIEDSVHAVFSDLIRNNNLAFDVKKVGISHLVTGSNIVFKGFREQGSDNIKGSEGVDVIWVDEAQSVSKVTLDKLIPTIRKNTSKIIFTMNRHTRDDAVIGLVGRDDVMHVRCNYYDNPFCPDTLKKEAELCRVKSESDYAHIWLGEPLDLSDDHLFNSAKLYESLTVQPLDGQYPGRQRVFAIDFAAQGRDFCVATTLERKSTRCWELIDRFRWQEKDTTQSLGRIIKLISTIKPDVSLIDVGNAGHAIYCELMAAGIHMTPFDGATTQNVGSIYRNARAEGYWLLKEWFENHNLIINQRDKEVLRQLERIKVKFREDGKRQLESKKDMKSTLGYSPDDADSLMMAVYGCIKHLGRKAISHLPENNVSIRRIGGSRRHLV